jgi:hypothetical protein
MHRLLADRVDALYNFQNPAASLINYKWPYYGVRKPSDTVGELKSAEICVPYIPSWKANKLGKLAQEKVLLEP